MSYKQHEQPQTFKAGEFVGESEGIVRVTMGVADAGSQEVQLVVGRYRKDDVPSHRFELVALEDVHAEILAKGLKLEGVDETIVIPQLAAAPAPAPVPAPAPKVAATPGRTIADVVADSRKLEAQKAQREAAKREEIRAGWADTAARVAGTPLTREQIAARLSPGWARVVQHQTQSS